MAKEIEVKPLKTNKLMRKKPIKLPPRCKRVIEGLILVLCLSGLIYQVTQLVMQYLERRTIVHLDFETLWYNRLPAITICYPYMIAMNKTAEKFPEVKQAFKEYKKLLDESDDYQFHDRRLRKVLNDIYDEKFLGFIRGRNLTFAQLAEISIPFKYTERTYEPIEERSSYRSAEPEKQFSSSVHFANFTRNPIDVLLTGLRRYPNGTIRYDTVEDSAPIESVVLNSKVNGEMNKCFTFYSHLNKTMRYYQMSIKQMHLTVRHHWDWFSPTLYNKRDSKLLFAMHSPNTIPQNLDTFMELETGWFYEIRYNRWKTVLLGPPYKTACLDYDLYTKKGDRLRSDCINNCILKEMDRTCIRCEGKNSSSCEPCFVRSDYLWRVETTAKYNDINRKMCHDFYDDQNFDDRDICIWNNQEHINHQCDSRCRLDCYNRYYNFAIFSKERLESELKDSPSPWDVETKIFIGHNQLPDQTTQHIEEMTFVTFAGNFGGLFGIWMGLSAYAILHYILQLI